MSAKELSAGTTPEDGEPPRAESEHPDDEEEAEAEDVGGFAGAAGMPFVQYVNAPYANLNTGSVYGDQNAQNIGAAGNAGGRRVEAHEGSIPAQEILEAKAGFAEPDWFPAALKELDTGLLFLAGSPGTGRRTAALNLLFQHSSGSMDLRALDSDVDLPSWRPTQAEARGYLVYGLLAKRPLTSPVIANLLDRLTEVHARMVILLPDDPELARTLSRELHITPVRCRPPQPGAVFDARLRSAVPNPAERDRLLARLEPGMLDELLAPDLVPSQVVELVEAVSRAGDTGPGFTDLRDRLSFLAAGEAPELIKQLRDDSDGLAFLLAACVFEGLDHRIVQEEAERLLLLADGSLDSLLPESGSSDGERGPATSGPRPNPKFLLRRSLDELLRMVRADCAPTEIRTASGYLYSVEPVRFTRHRQAEEVLRHVWRQYGHLSSLLADWMGRVSGNERELAEPAGRVLGMAAGWGGGRRALSHISKLANSDSATTRAIAAYALSMAAADPILASEVKHRLRGWSYSAGPQLRSTVAHVCGTDFGASRPDRAIRLLRSAYRGRDGEEAAVGVKVRGSLCALSGAGRQPTVVRRLAEWVDTGGREAELALWTFPQLLWEPAWLQEQLVGVSEFTEKIIELVHRVLNDDEHFEATRSALLNWCRMAYGYEQQTTAVETLLTALAQGMARGELRLFVEIDRYDAEELAGRHIARHALDRWRNGESPEHGSATPHGGPHDH